MKKLLTILAAAAVAAAAVSCGSAKKAQTAAEKTLGEEIAKSPAQVYAEEAPDDVQRAWASYNDFDQTVATRGAAALARGELASQVGALVNAGIDIYRGKHGQNVSDGSSSAEVKEGSTKAEDEGGLVSEELIQGSKIVKTNIYKQKDGTYTAYVCVEVNIDMVIESAKNNQKLQSVISEGTKATIDENREDFKESLEEAYERYRKMKGRE